jgi:cardiolipin synthase
MTDRAAPEDRILTIPNLLSLVRLGLVPVFLALVITSWDKLALLVLIIASLTDLLDGWIARRFNQMSRLGAVLDPAADRLYIVAALIGLAWRDVVPWWFFAVVIARDLMLIVVGVVLANHGYGPLPVHHMGKVATFCLLLALPILLLAQIIPEAGVVVLPIGWALALWGAFLYWWAGIVYVRETIRVIRMIGDDGGADSDTLEGREV